MDPTLPPASVVAPRPNAWRAGLPSRGNLLLSGVMLAVVLGLSQRVGAFRATAPQVASTATIPYQGRLADASGIPLDGSYAMTFKLYSVSSGGSSLWTETWSGGSSVVVADGLFNVLLGSLTPISSTTFSANASLWLGLAVGADSEMAPRVQLGSAPFSMQAMVVPDGSITSSKLAPSLHSLTPAVYSDHAAVSEGLHHWPSTGTSKANISFKVPYDYVSGDLTVRENLYEHDTSAGTIAKMTNDLIVYLRLGGIAGGTTTTNTDLTFGTSYQVFTIPAGTFSAGDLIWIRQRRYGDDGADTAGRIDLMTIEVEYWGR